MKIVVLKFGGTSVGTIKKIKRVARIIIDYKKKNYKVIVVWGKAYFVYMNRPTQKGLLVDYYDREGNRLTVRQSKKYKRVVKHTPQNLPQVFDVAERLVSQFAVCRVDLYYENDTVYLGELTFDVSIPGIDEDLFKLCPVDKLI